MEENEKASHMSKEAREADLNHKIEERNAQIDKMKNLMKELERKNKAIEA